MQRLKRLYIDSSKKKKLIVLCSAFFIVMTFLISLISFSLAALTATESIEILSEKLNYENGEQGSWKIKKSANWISKGKVKISYVIDTKAMAKSENVDLLLVVNTSNSLTDEQFSTMKTGLNQLTDNILKDGSSDRMALLSFNTNYTLVSDFTNDKATITSGINNLTMASGSSYYKGFVGVDEVLSNYQANGSNKLVVIFVTNSLPNKDMPNEDAQYAYLKNKYSNLTINAVAYDMSSSIPTKLKSISDKQFNATDETLVNILANATNKQFNYSNFTIDDYIDTDNFSIDNLGSFKTNYGSATLVTDSTGKKVAINLDNLVSGNKVELSYEINLNTGKENDKLFPVNKSIGAKSTLGEIVEEVTSAKMPVVADNYSVSYLSNVPSGCNINTTLPDSTYYSVFSTVKMENSLTCDGYQFKGWELVSDKKVTMVNDSNFLMPAADVLVKGTWSKLSLTKSMDGTVYTPQTLNSIIEGQAVLDNVASTYVTSDTGIDFTKDASDTNGKGVYTMASTKDNEFPIHYYRGSITNNNVKYAGYCWKIVRTTDTGGVKLIYNGAPDSSTGACNSSAPYIAESVFNDKSNALSDVGYMYGNDRYENTDINMDYTWWELNGKSLTSMERDAWYGYSDKISYIEDGVAATAAGLLQKYYFSSTVTYDSSTGQYTLVSPKRDYVNLLHTDAEGKYTCHDHSKKSCKTVGYVLKADTGAYKYVEFSGGEDERSVYEKSSKLSSVTNFLYGKSVTYDETSGLYTLNDTIEAKHIVSLDDTKYSNIYNNYKYTCFSTSNTCSSVKYFADSYLDVVQYVTMENGETYDSLYANASTDQYTYMYGNDVSYDESTGIYTLIDPISSHLVEYNNDKNSITSNHHYFCTNNQSSCSVVNYAYYTYESSYRSRHNHTYYFEYDHLLSWQLSGGKNTTDVLDTLYQNDNDSVIKSKIDAWYNDNIIKYGEYLEDTVWCNGRKLVSTDNFDKDKNINTRLLFDNNSADLSCSNVTDKFSVSDKIGNGKLTYPIGMLTRNEFILSGAGTANNYLNKDVAYWLLSPYYYGADSSMYAMYSSKYSSEVPSTLSYSLQYLRPSVSLKNGLMVYAGDGTTEKPYILESLAKRITIVGNDDIKASPGAALPGEKISLISKSGLFGVLSFKLNGEEVSGSEFIMPDTEAVITDIVASNVIQIKGNDDIDSSASAALPGTNITLFSKSGNQKVYSFKLNGETIVGSEFTMPNATAVVTDIVVKYRITVKENDDIVASEDFALPGTIVSLSSRSGKFKVSSFYLNGTQVYEYGGDVNEFTMPNGTATITDIRIKNKVTIIGNDDIVASPDFAFANTNIDLSSKSGKYVVYSFKVNGKTIEDYNRFVMPDSEAVITDIVVKGAITIYGNNNIYPSEYSAFPGTTITLSSYTQGRSVVSFKLNGTLINGSSFTMPDTYADITATSIEVVYESEHNPYPNSMSKEVYADQTFDGAKSIDVSITYETQNTFIYPDYINVYDGNGKELKKLKGKKATENFTISGNHIKITFTSDAVLNNYYGFRAVCKVNYD